MWKPCHDLGLASRANDPALEDRLVLNSAEPAAAPAATAAQSPLEGRRAGYVLILFLSIHIVLNIDRSILSVALEPIKREYGLKDAQLGLLSLGFAAFFAIAGLPLGRWVDKGLRRIVLSLCVGFFSLMTAVAGATHSFAQLLITRFAVGAGEAGGGPAMLSMLSDLYPAHRRASAISAYYVAVPFGFVITFLVGSWVAQTFGWRHVFFLAGAPGLMLAAVAILTLKEPVRGDAESRHVVAAAQWHGSLRFVLSQPAQRHVLATTMITSSLSAAVITWSMSFLIRSHGVPLARAGLILAFIYGLIGAAGAAGGGRLADRLAKHDIRWRAWTCAIAVALALPALAVFLLSPSLVVACSGLAAWSMLTNSIFGPGIALSQSLAPPRMRGAAASIFYLLSNLVGVGVGPLLIGLVSDRLRPTHGPDSLRFALLYLSVIYLWAALHFLFAGKTLRADLARIEPGAPGLASPTKGGGHGASII
jgi:predicted MFS family arabinose efflux permease